MEEIWKDVKWGYKVSNFGRLRNSKNKIVKLDLNSAGYLIACIQKDKIRVRQGIHRLVAKAFIPNINNAPYVGHRDNDKLNNRVDNLKWCTQSENIKDAYNQNRMIGNTGNLRIDVKELPRLLQLKLEGKTIKELRSTFNVGATAIYSHLKRAGWTKNKTH